MNSEDLSEIRAGGDEEKIKSVIDKFNTKVKNEILKNFH